VTGKLNLDPAVVARARELARRILDIRPDIKVVLMSAYDVSGVAATGWPFIPKPFGVEGLKHKIADVLKERSRTDS